MATKPLPPWRVQAELSINNYLESLYKDFDLVFCCSSDLFSFHYYQVNDPGSAHSGLMFKSFFSSLEIEIFQVGFINTITRASGV